MILAIGALALVVTVLVFYSVWAIGQISLLKEQRAKDRAAIKVLRDEVDALIRKSVGLR